MTRLFLTTLFLTTLATGIAFTSEAHAISTQSTYGQRMIEHRAQRRAERLVRIQKMLVRRTERQSLRLTRRSRKPARTMTEMQLEFTLPSFPEIKQTGTVELRQTTKTTPKTHNYQPTTDRVLPNQLFTPTTPLPTFDATNSFLVLGEEGREIATIKATPQDEPVEVRIVRIRLSASSNSIGSFEVFDDLGFVLGQATIDLAFAPEGNVYTLSLDPDAAYFIMKRDEVVLAVRPRMKDQDEGGASGEEVQVTAIDLVAIGQWTSRTNMVSTSGPNFQKHHTANAIITKIAHSGPERGTFATGTNKKLASFIFEARTTEDGTPALTALTFSVSAPSAVTLSNAFLRGNDSDTEHSCTVASSTITCSAIPASIGDLESTRILSLFSDISVSSHPDPFLQVELNNPGRPDSAGDITWTDGTTSFTWVPFDPPVAVGTSWE